MAVDRWHLIVRGRIVASVDAKDGDAAEEALPKRTDAKLVSDVDWREAHWRRPMRDVAKRILRHHARRVASCIRSRKWRERKERMVQRRERTNG